MAVVTTRHCRDGRECIALACAEKVFVATLFPSSDASSDVTVSVQQLTVTATLSPVICNSFSNSGHHLAVCTDDKTLKVWETTNWTVIGERAIPKRGIALQFSGSDQQLLVADKTGEVTSYLVADLAAQGKHLLGHFSIILDMVLSPSNSHVITCDRDEKIRVSRYPNSYNIESFCLGHTEFVSRICICEKWPNILLSASGDGTVRSWDWLAGKLLHTEVCSEAKEGTDPLAVTYMVCSGKGNDLVIVVALESCSDLRTFQLHSDGKLAPLPEAAISLAMPPWSLVFDWSDVLWACLPNEHEPLVCFQVENGRFRKLSHLEHPLLQNLCKWDHFKGCVGQERDWSQLRKHVYDNVSAYLARKEERIRSKETKMAAMAEIEPRSPKLLKLDSQEATTRSSNTASSTTSVPDLNTDL